MRFNVDKERAARPIQPWDDPAEIAALKRIFTDPAVTNKAEAMRKWLPDRSPMSCYQKAAKLGFYVPRSVADRRAAYASQDAADAAKAAAIKRSGSSVPVAERLPDFLRDVFAGWGVG